jgi:predicted RNase H-like HicB family nuclease
MATIDHYIDPRTGLVIQVEEDVTGGYFALVPALPGCGSQGESISETLQNVSDAIEAVLDVLSEDQPERWAGIIGCVTAQVEVVAEFDSTSHPKIQILAAA